MPVPAAVPIFPAAATRPCGLLCAVCPKVHPVDTTGAGDIFGGSAMARLLELDKPVGELTEDDLKFIGSFAATAASLSTEASGGIPSIPEMDAVLKAMG